MLTSPPSCASSRGVANLCFNREVENYSKLQYKFYADLLC